MSESNKKFEEVTVQSISIFQGKMISLQVDQVRLSNGEMSAREIVKHPGAVAVLAVHEDRMIVVEQYRKPLEKSIVEIPAGKLDSGENPMDAAIRELQEETGFTCPSIRHISSFYTSPGFANEIVHLYFADKLTAGNGNLDEDELLECSSITLEEAREYMTQGRINDAKTIMAVYAWQIYRLTGRF